MSSEVVKVSMECMCMVLVSVAHTVPSFFPWCYNLVKGLVDENTRSKVFFLGSEFTSETLYRECMMEHSTMQVITRRCC